ncbi:MULTISPECIES: hypothetical protein [Paenibacillus]|jgi:hypothetical protein|uniref:Uncharacterized protein n=1 Tax=Paenibacillus lautus TaxID=1401 RepID=A0A385TZ13_PAELA|nr:MULTISPECIES: hypothetical protein [Paenibacillus]AWP25305.1 hypothetical protein B9D94_01090 [Paenibacillus sp. Cedars]AYB48178.1 hypothetical protein D5F53_33235 [Paenibacillus lautus]VTR32003.1 Uncharacterised protein [Actinobacillus pleuropneumoniae]
MINQEILSQLESHFSEHIPDFSEVFEILRLDSEQFILMCQESDLKIVINWNDLRKKLPVYISAKLNKDNEYSSLIEDLYDHDFKEFNKGFLFIESCGYHYKRYGEFLLTYQNYFYYKTPKINQFKIGDVEIEIAVPSSLYRLMFNHFTNDDNFVDGWEGLFTLRVVGCDKTDLERTLQQALFLIAKYDPPELVGDYPQIIPFEFEGDNYLWNDSSVDEPESYDFVAFNYTEPIAFYNIGRKLNDPLYFYRVLEYFFIINKKSEIQGLVDNYNQANKIDTFVESITKLYGTRENVLLENLLSNLYDIDSIVYEAYKDGLIQVNDIPTFSQKLYEYRNSIVHGKKDVKLDLNVPKILDPSPNDYHWNAIIQSLAEKVIEQFC